MGIRHLNLKYFFSALYFQINQSYVPDIIYLVKFIWLMREVRTNKHGQKEEQTCIQPHPK